MHIISPVSQLLGDKHHLGCDQINVCTSQSEQNMVRYVLKSQRAIVGRGHIGRIRGMKHEIPVRLNECRKNLESMVSGY